MGMMDLKEKSCLSEDGIENRKCCSDCKTTRTPLWRGGPAGPKSLCNACGIRYRKKRRAMMCSGNVPDKKKNRSNNSAASTAATTNPYSTMINKRTPTGSANTLTSPQPGLTRVLKVKLKALGDNFMLQTSNDSRSPSLSPSPVPPVVVKKQRCQRRRKLKEEEQAAFLLMALSCGSVFA